VDPIRKDAAEVAEGLADIESPDSKLANNLLLFLCYLCMFNTVHANMMFDVLDLLAQRLSEVWTDHIVVEGLNESLVSLECSGHLTPAVGCRVTAACSSTLWISFAV
jgi:hypothetical protein